MMSENYLEERRNMIELFQTWSDMQKLDYIERLLHTMGHYQIARVDLLIRPMLQRDFISNLHEDLPACILKYLDAETLKNCEQVSTSWLFQVARAQAWRKMIERHVKSDSMWKGLGEKNKWRKFILVTREVAQQLICDHYTVDYNMMKKNYYEMIMLQHKFYQALYPKVLEDIARIENNWKKANYSLKTIECNSSQSKGVYTLQFDDDKIICGLRDNSIKIWDREELTCTKTLIGHTGSVLCLQYDHRFIISGSSDGTIRVWDIESGECIHTLIHHREAVLHLRFHNSVMVSSSKDRTVAVWDIWDATDMKPIQMLIGHRAAVNVIDFDEKYIVSASGDRTIRVWSTDDYKCERILVGHTRGIACLQYRGNLIVSGSSDKTIRVWDITTGICHRVLEGHDELVRCLRFDDKWIVSGAYDGKIKVWDLKAVLDTSSPAENICINTLEGHTGRVFRLQFDEFQIVSSSHDDTIRIWDFFNTSEVKDEPMSEDSNSDSP